MVFWHCKIENKNERCQCASVRTYVSRIIVVIFISITTFFHFISSTRFFFFIICIFLYGDKDGITYAPYKIRQCVWSPLVLKIYCRQVWKMCLNMIRRCTHKSEHIVLFARSLVLLATCATVAIVVAAVGLMSFYFIFRWAFLLVMPE